jgi:hypothetical protein
MDADPQKLLDQLNENWRQLRLFKTAMADRDQVISELHNSIHQRDEAIKGLNKTIKLSNRIRPLVYAALGAAIPELIKLAIQGLGLIHIR